MTVYRMVSAMAPDDCPRCGAHLGGSVRALFELDRPAGLAPDRVLEMLRQRAAARRKPGLSGRSVALEQLIDPLARNAQLAGNRADRSAGLLRSADRGG
jgi:hypothetical protein